MESLSFRPRARLLVQLGDQLIKNESIAVLELVKNAYDADARNVIVDMDDIDDRYRGVITILDDGFGMDIDIFRNYWLEPGSDFKKVSVPTPMGRTPIGEKGIGRFGVHKLGKKIEIISKKIGKKEAVLSFDWSTIENTKYLSDTRVDIYEREPEFFKTTPDGEELQGTLILISDLSKDWDKVSYQKLYRTIQGFNSPFEDIKNFKVICDTNIPKFKEKLLTFEEIKKYALFESSIEIEGNQITGYEYSFNPYSGLFLEGRISNNLKDSFLFKNARDTEGVDLSKFKIGKVRINILSFDLKTSFIKKYIPGHTGLKEYLNTNGGMRVYRDGMRVLDYGEEENDWLNLGKERLSKGVGSAISNTLFLGAVYLDRKESTDLVEKANREGFIENDAYIAFKSAVAIAFSKFTSDRNIDKRRLTYFLEGGDNLPLTDELLDIKDFVQENLEDSDAKNEIITKLNRASQKIEKIIDTYTNLASVGQSYSIVIHEIEKTVKELKHRVADIDNFDKVNIKSTVERISRLVDGYADMIRLKDKKEISLETLVDNALFNVQYRLQAHGLNVIRDIEDSTVECSVGLINSIIANIIDNSIWWLYKYQIKDKKIYIKTTDKLLGYTSLIIADNGKGFTIPTADAILPFVTTKPDGMGLGLNLAHEIMLAHKGQLVFPKFEETDLPKEFRDGAIIALCFKDN